MADRERRLKITVEASEMIADIRRLERKINKQLTLRAGRVLIKAVTFMHAQDALDDIISRREREEKYDGIDGAYLGTLPVDDPVQQAQYRRAVKRRYAAKRSLLTAVRRLKG